MTDTVDPQTRSRIMSAIKGKDTKPELLIRKALFAEGFRYRLHPKNLPGKPDIVLPRYRAVIFVNGCFWHFHGCPSFHMPHTRCAWWGKKLAANRSRDIEHTKALLKMGYRVCTVWECAVMNGKKETEKRLSQVISRLTRWLHGKRSSLEIG